ncbi:NAD(P)/FAD-dependent oxidoreductase [Halocatena marina]|uniref:NAD(P)/FAD-dependent oxidoreductase n=1 Tax=Halocatena marina TaxID=2934937 RepID=UPI00200FFC2E|nr:FAD-dependent oxidoreductase [Halocatena marina]
MRVAVLGAGAVGVTAALELASQDVDVTVYEQGTIESGSSGRAAGVCYDAYAGRIDARIGDRALARFQEFSGMNGFDFTLCPYVWLARENDEKRAAAIREQVPRMRANGRDVSLIDSETLAERYPALNVDSVAVAAIARNAGHTDPASYVRAVADHAVETGATILTNTPATLRAQSETTSNANTEIETPDGHESFDAVLVATGAHTKHVLAAADIPIPLKPYRVQALTTEPIAIDVPMLFDATGGYYLRPHGDGLLVGDGTEPIERDPDGWKREADEWFLEAIETHLETAVGRTFARDRAWAGLCTATPDGDPLLGEIAPNVFVAAGWQGHGFMRAPALGEMIAEQIVDGDGIEAFDPKRFDGDETFEIREGMDIG